MKIFMLFPYAPLPPPLDLGGTKRNLPFLLENLKRHEVSVLSFGTREEKRKFMESVGKSCKHVRFVDRKRPRIINGLEQLWLLVTGRSTFRQLYRKKMQEQLDELLRKEKFDILHCCTQMFGYFRFPKDIPVISDTHEVTYDLLYRTYKKTKNVFVKLMSRLAYKFGKPEEIELCKKFDAIIATTERDGEVFQKDLPNQKMFVIQNGVDPAFLEFNWQEPEPKTMVFTGKMSFYPNNHGIIYFLEDIFPRVQLQEPSARLYVVGVNPSKELLRRASENVVVTGFVEDVRPYMARAEVYIIPLLIGGGIRGKALEAMAMKKPIVSTSIGCEGINLKHGESALFADTPEGFAAAVLRLFNDRALCMKLGQKAYENVVSGYNWKTKGEELDRVYQAVVLQRA
jgi:glycosyltransferase involved in cell wall biosynthesis